MTGNFNKKFAENLAKNFKKIDLASMYTLCNKREQDLKDEVKALKKQLAESKHCAMCKIRKDLSNKEFGMECVK